MFGWGSVWSWCFESFWRVTAIDGLNQCGGFWLKALLICFIIFEALSDLHGEIYRLPTSTIMRLYKGYRTNAWMPSCQSIQTSFLKARWLSPICAHHIQLHWCSGIISRYVPIGLSIAKLLAMMQITNCRISRVEPSRVLLLKTVNYMQLSSPMRGW